ncbi:MAG: enoyl-CoA hydratase-related protein, partial [Firmicutes bacterium]|nr:enoyl-CoA hydratase-related protein [Bacillota bacterium]
MAVFNGSGPLDQDGIQLAEENGIAEISWNNPRCRQCLTGYMWKTLESMAHMLAQRDNVQAVILRGGAEDFSSGLDLAELAGAGAHEEALRPIFDQLERTIHAFAVLP